MKVRVYLRFVCFCLALTPALASSNDLLTNTLRALKDSRTAALSGVPLLSGRLLADFYAQRDDAFVWTDPARVRALLALIEASESDGFSPSDFHAETLKAMSAGGALTASGESERIAMDILLSDALLRYVHHTRYGKVDPVILDPKWNDRPPVSADKLIAEMSGALDAESMSTFLASRIQEPFWYRDLKQSLASYLAKAHLKDLSSLPGGRLLAQGDRDPRVGMVRERLRLLGADSLADPLDPTRFDADLRQAVMDFQRRQGLSHDGVVGPATIAALNSPFDEQKLNQMRINLERMRWLYQDLPADYLFVDVADYQVRLIRAGEILWTTRVVVGTPDAQTPMFRDSMEHLVFNPTWTVPVSIQKAMGRVSARYTLVDRRTGHKVSGGNASNYKRYRVVQQPGPKNALGRVKFMFPNRHAVYLHDTPSKSLFGRSRRALSHGCVRVENPEHLAELVLQGSSWDRAAIDRVIGAKRTRYVNLDQELPVLLYYLTAYADASGVHFRPDVYGRDQALRDAFLGGPSLNVRIVFPEPADDSKVPSVNPSDGEDDASPNGVRLTRSGD
ncbi:ErfK/YbiS/YcfS/YnhG family protein [Thiorhodococcus drewsii AZ1]|uniref:ErfK/YbiS/YcfS/YnhG family protein n=1 Tax=Thiorhodococcus drewsii AZ1 TaxID=765913 RepID=G2DXT2_9GAMM|nr:L,D-transpeptidase family protein [Thiorhodococcus drewsii]EGV33131.1 ErfK/YbiS/YcfS/YnhG family protein [Thiorhodococcus drewsii AZ1]